MGAEMVAFLESLSGFKLVLRVDSLAAWIAEKGENPKGPTRKDPKVSGRAL